MKRIFVFSMVAAVALAMGMGVGLTAADEDWPTDQDDLERGDVLEAIEQDREDVPEDTRTAVNNWATANADELTADELEDVREWLRGEPETSDPPEDFDVDFGSGAWITDYSLEDGEATITFKTDQSQTVTVTDALQGIDREGAVQVTGQEFDLERGESTISMDVREVRGSSTVGVSVGGTTVRLSTEMQAPEQDENPFRHFGGESGLFSGIIMTVGLAAVGTAYVLRSEDSGVIEA